MKIVENIPSKKSSRILFWNVFCENDEVGRIQQCIGHFEPDLLVLCEVTFGHLAEVSEVYRYVVYALDYLQNGKECLLIIAAHTALTETDIRTHFDRTKEPASWLARQMGWVEFLDTISATCTELGFRILCLHLTAGCGPSKRRSELELASSQIDNIGPFVVAGDFNSFSEPWLAPFVAVPLAYSSEDWFCRERRSNDSWFQKRGFVRSVDGVTFPRFGLKMDQVYVRGLTIQNSGVARELWGSDHHPIFVDVLQEK